MKPTWFNQPPLTFNGKLEPGHVRDDGMYDDASVIVNPAHVLYIAEVADYRATEISPMHLSVLIHLVGGRELIVCGPIQEVRATIWPSHAN